MPAQNLSRCLEVDHLGEVTVANFTGREILEDAAMHSFAEQLAQLAEDVGGRQLLLNFGNVKNFNSRGLSSVVACHQKLQASDGRLVVCNLEPSIYEIFKATHLDDLLAAGGAEGPPATEPEVRAPAAPAGGRRWLPVVLCDPRPDRARRLLTALGRELSVVHLSSLDALDRYCARHTSAAVVLPLHWAPPGGHAGGEASPAVLDFLRAHGRQVPPLVYADTQHLALETYCQALAAGARQIINEASSTFAQDLTQVLARIVQDHLADLDEQQRLTALFARHGLIGKSAALRDVFRRAVKASHFSDLPVLLMGETGTGKQRLAEAIHQLDVRRRDRPFVTVNCGALSKSLVESELFGHTKGAFSELFRHLPDPQEREDRPTRQSKIDGPLGLFRSADGGTLLLDEVGELEPDLQPKLLRVLQERRLLPVGADYEHAIDIRVIAATNRPLDRLVAEGEFREDLYQRLNVFQVRIPPRGPCV
jgi:anti-anti-sigma factor